MSSSEGENEPSGGGRRVVTRVASLSSLVGAHPGALRAIFGAGRATDPSELGNCARGRVLGLSPGASLFFALRPLIRAFAEGLCPWTGMTFDHGGNSGRNVIVGRNLFRFRAEVGPSLLDGRPALVLTYGEPAYGNPRVLHTIRDELRTAPGAPVALGATMISGSRSPKEVLWFGLEPTPG